MATTINTNQTTTSPATNTFLGIPTTFSQLLRSSLESSGTEGQKLTEQFKANQAFAKLQNADLQAVKTPDKTLRDFSGQKSTVGATNIGQGGYRPSSLAAQFGVRIAA